MASTAHHRPLYATVWFNALLTAILLAVLFALTFGRETPLVPKGFGNFIVTILLIYWVFVFPRLRKNRDSPDVR